MAEIPEPPFGGFPTGVPGGAAPTRPSGGGSGGGAAGFFGGAEGIRQILLWQVVGQLIAPIIAPVGQAIANEVWPKAADVPLSPADAALALLRGNIDQGSAENEAGRNGVNTTRFGVMVDNTGEPISVDQALFLWRRGLLAEADLERAIRQSRVRNEWIPAIKALSQVPLSVSDAVDAAVENQMPKGDAAVVASYSGVALDDFEILYNTRGRPPGEAQLLELVRRGIIPEGGTGPQALSLEQGISESAIKDKWIPAYRALLTYLPPPRTITALERSGAITPDQAQHLYQEAGLSPELAAAYSHEASHTKLAAHRNLTEATVLRMYAERFLTGAQATPLLEVLGYTGEEIATLLAWTDVQRELKAVDQALSKLRTLYVGRKMGATTLHGQLGQLGVSGDHQAELLRIWTIERDSAHATLTAAQIATALIPSSS